MSFFSRRIHKAVSTLDTVQISEQNGVRCLHLGDDAIQSAMRLTAPNDLELSYTQAMMGFLLFGDVPDNALLIGLGGGSVAKFLYHQFPHMALCAVDNHPEVIKAAYQYFYLPHDEQRLNIVQADAAENIIHQRDWDSIFLDGFDAHCQVDALATEIFYRQCRDALSQHGVISINLWGSDKLFGQYCQRIEHAFDGRTLKLSAERYGNVVVFAFNAQPKFQHLRQLKFRAAALETQLKLPFTRFLDNILPSAGWLLG